MAKHNPFDQRGSKRKWAADTIQGAWRGYKKHKKGGPPTSLASTQSYGAFIPHAGLATYSAARSAFAAFKPKFKQGGIKAGKVQMEGSSAQCSYFTSHNADFLEKSVSKTLAPVKSVMNGFIQILSTPGLQAAQVALPIYNYADVAVCYADIAGASTQDRVILSDCKAEVNFTNCFLANCTFDIYDIFARKDAGATVCGDAVAAWTQGDVDEGAALEYTKIGSTPFETELFNQFFKVVQKTRVVLPGGALHKHQVHVSPHKLMTYSYMNNTTKLFREMTYNCLVVLHGQPANQVTGTTGGSMGAAGLNIVYGKEYVTKLLYDNKAKIVDHTTLATTFTGGEQIVNVGGSTVTTNLEG